MYNSPRVTVASCIFKYLVLFKKKCFPVRISSVNVTKSSFFVQCYQTLAKKIKDGSKCCFKNWNNMCLFSIQKKMFHWQHIYDLKIIRRGFVTEEPQDFIAQIRIAWLGCSSYSYINLVLFLWILDKLC